MKRLLRWTWVIVLALLMSGCSRNDPGDRRAAEMAGRLVEQQGRKLMILDRLYLAILIVDHEVWIDFGDFFGDETVLK